MACERDCITKLVEYIESQGVEVNIGRNNARGNKGFFKVVGKNNYRIDISNGLNETEILRVLVHEFAHYVHYKYDKTLKSAEFLFGSDYNLYEDDLINLTVDSIPKCSIKPLFHQKETLKSEISELSRFIKNIYPDFKISEPFKIIENEIQKPAKYLLKYDRVKVIEGFGFRILSIDDIDKSFPKMSDVCKKYLMIQSKRRMLKRITSKISRLNRYYNSVSELISRSFEYYILRPEIMQAKAPALYVFYNKNTPKIKYIANFIEIAKNCLT